MKTKHDENAQLNKALQTGASGFYVSTIPIESNYGYEASTKYSYETLSLWFNLAKLTLTNRSNYSELRSDRLEAVYDCGNTFLNIYFSDRGFSDSQTPSFQVKADNRFNSGVVGSDAGTTNTVVHYFPLPEREENESLEKLTKRWVYEVHTDVQNVIVSLGLRVNWFEFPFERHKPACHPPELFAP